MIIKVGCLVMKSLYLCYFGLREPLVQTQVLPYLRQLVAGGIEVFLLTFEPDPSARWSREEVEAWTGRLRVEGIRWTWRAYHKRPSLPATVYDMLAGAWTASRLVRRHRIDVLHARAHVAAVMGGLTKRLTGRPLIFDVRGFNPEEYVDAGVWRENGLKFSLAKAMEKWLFRVADGFVVLTERAREILFPGCRDADRLGRPIEVIPCCVDLERFGTQLTPSRCEMRRELRLEGRRVIAYVGALGGFYLTDEMLEFLATAHQQDVATFSMILTQSPAELVRKFLAQRGVREQDCLVRRVPPAEVPGYLRAADIAISFIKPTYSKAASSPTKIAEYLSCGLPVVCNGGVGDLDEVIESDGVGVVVRGFSRDSFLDALRAADILRRSPETFGRCLESARRRFDLETVGGPRYRRLYDRIMVSAGATSDPEVGSDG